MSFERTSAGVLFVVVVGGVVGCTAYPTVKPVAPNCAVEEQYEFQSVAAFEPNETPNPILWSAADVVDAGIYNGTSVYALTPIEGGRCLGGVASDDSTSALVLVTRDNKDWGSLLGIIFGPRDARAYEGLSFWARAPGATTKGFTISLNDSNTGCLGETDGGVCVVEPSNCITYGGDAGTGMAIYDGTGMVIPGTGSLPPAPDACGNPYAATVLAKHDWSFHTIPFKEFQQGATPNRVPNAALTQAGPVPGTALLTNELLNLVLRMPKEAITELWLDNVSFYRRRAPGTGGDGGVDAPQM